MSIVDYIIIECYCPLMKLSERRNLFVVVVKVIWTNEINRRGLLSICSRIGKLVWVYFSMIVLFLLFLLIVYIGSGSLSPCILNPP